MKGCQIIIVAQKDIPLFLVKLLILSLETGTNIHHWKTSFIIPRHKSGDKTEMNNYRRINIASIISRIMETQLMMDFLTVCFMKNIIDSQHGIFKSRSCMI